MEKVGFLDFTALYLGVKTVAPPDDEDGEGAADEDEPAEVPAKKAPSAAAAGKGEARNK